MRDGGHDAKRAAVAEQFAPRRETFGTVTPKVDQDLAFETLGFDDPPDFERGALFGAHD